MAPPFDEVDARPEAVEAFCKRLHQAVQAGAVVVTRYAAERAEVELQWDEWDILQQLLELRSHDFHRCETANQQPDQIIWVFTPELWDGECLWIRLIERASVVVISFHPA